MNTQRNARYALSFTSGSLLTREAQVATPLFFRERDWATVRHHIEADNLLQARTAASGQRLAREVVQRLAVLGTGELELLTDATPTERGHLLWVAACRRYALIGEFAEEVVRERFLLLTPTLGHGDFDSFLRGKALWHDEVAGLKDSTARKLRSNLFRMLIEAGLVTEDGRILAATLSARVLGAVSDDVRFFPLAGGTYEHQ